MAFFVTAGSKIYIGGVHPLASTDLNLASFALETWTQIKGVETISTFGASASAVEFTNIEDARKLTGKGARDSGSIDLDVGLDYADAGQLALVAAEATKDNFAFKIEFNDAPAAGTPSARYFVGPVMSATENLDSVNAVMKLNASIVINSNVVRVAAA